MQTDIIFLTGVCHPNSFNRAQGAYRLASILRETGYKVRIIDGVGTLPSNKIVEMIETVISPATIAVCISTSFFSNFNSLVHADSLVTKDPAPYDLHEWLSIVNIIKLKSNAKIILGGHKTNEFERSEIHRAYVDKFVYGYADKSLIKIISDIKYAPKPLSHDLIKSTEFGSYQTYYDPKDSFLPGESFTVEMQRGCMFRCSFCAYPMNGKDKNSYQKEINNLVDELEYCYDVFGSTNFILNSDTFNANMSYVEEFYNELQRRKLVFNFGINARLDLFYRKDEQIQLTKDLGVRAVLFGLETANPFALKDIGKGLAFDKVVTTLHKCKEIWQDRVRMTGSYIIGLPKDTEQNIQSVYEFFQSEECPLHGIEFDPLYVFNKDLETNLWQSEYTKFPEKHGFKFNGTIMDWENENTPYKTFQNSVERVQQMVMSFSPEKRGTIKSAAYLHLPNNLDENISSSEKFEKIFKMNTYSELREFYKSRGTTLEKSRFDSADRYFKLFMKNNGN